MARADAIRSRRRPAFTLIELIVVMTIIAVLGGLSIAFLTAFNVGDSAARGGTTVQQTVTIAKAEALRGRRPYGVRLTPDAAGLVTQLQFIEQPDDFFNGRVSAAAGSTTISLPDADLTGGMPSQALWPVQVGDYIEIKSSGLVRQITGVSANAVTVASAVPYAIPLSPMPPSGVAPHHFRIIRSPRVVGEEPVPLPQDIVIDTTTNNTFAAFGQPLPLDAAGNIDILFSPSGAVMGRGASDQPIYLWVRNSTIPLTNPLTQGDDTIIVIFPQTGASAAHRVNTPGDPYFFTRQGNSSGE